MLDMVETDYDMHADVLREIKTTFAVATKDRSVKWWVLIMIAILVIILVVGVFGYFAGDYMIRLLVPSLPNLGL